MTKDELSKIYSKLHTVESSNLESAGYDEEEKKLFLVFKNSSFIYIYSEFPAVVWGEFEESESKGKYFYAYIKEKYRFTKVNKIPDQKEDDKVGIEVSRAVAIKLESSQALEGLSTNEVLLYALRLYDLAVEDSQPDTAA